MITRKALIVKLQTMNLDTILFAGSRRTAQHRGQAVEIALARFLPRTTFGQTQHATGMGAMKKNPKWFTQLYTDLSWASGDITPGSILQALS